MEKIRTIDLVHLSNASHFQYMTDFGVFATAASPNVAALLAPYMPLFGTLLAQEDELFKQIQKSGYTEQIKQADRERSGLYDGLWRVVRAQVHDVDSPVAQAAGQVLERFDTYGSISRKTYAEETALVANLLGDLEAMPQQVLGRTNIRPLVTKLREVNTYIAGMLHDRDEEQAEIRLQEKMRDARRRIDAVYQAMIGVVNASLILNPEAYSLFVSEINTLIARYRKRHKSTSTDTGEGNGEPEDGGEEEEIDVIEETKIIKKTR